jgi:hypothetical protein
MRHALRTAIGVAALLLVPACNVDPTVEPAKGYFNLINPGNVAIGVVDTPTFNWEDSFSVETPTYTIQVATDAAFTSPVINQSGLTSPTFTPGSPLSDGTTYYWQVLAVRSSGTVVSTDAPWSFTTFSATPAAFTMIAPTNLATNIALTPSFSWNTSVGAASYTVQVTTPADTTFTTPVINQTGIGLTSFKPVSLLNPGTAYIWQVIAVSTNNTTATGAPWGFTTTPPSTVTLSAPPNGPSPTVPATPSITFSWTSTGTPTSYTLQISTDSFATFAVNQTGITATSSSITTLSGATVYSWRVLALDSANNVLGTSSTFTFTTS